MARPSWASGTDAGERPLGRLTARLAGHRSGRRARESRSRAYTGDRLRVRFGGTLRRRRRRTAAARRARGPHDWGYRAGGLRSLGQARHLPPRRAPGGRARARVIVALGRDSAWPVCDRAAVGAVADGREAIGDLLPTLERAAPQAWCRPMRPLPVRVDAACPADWASDRKVDRHAASDGKSLRPAASPRPRRGWRGSAAYRSGRERSPPVSSRAPRRRRSAWADQR